MPEPVSGEQAVQHRERAVVLDAARDLGVEPHSTVAIGDGSNDVQMLRWAARGVAMGHAPQGTRLAADEVTGGIEDDGALAVLRSLVA